MRHSYADSYQPRAARNRGSDWGSSSLEVRTSVLRMACQLSSEMVLQAGNPHGVEDLESASERGKTSTRRRPKNDTRGPGFMYQRCKVNPHVTSAINLPSRHSDTASVGKGGGAVWG